MPRRLLTLLLLLLLPPDLILLLLAQYLLALQLRLLLATGLVALLSLFPLHLGTQLRLRPIERGLVLPAGTLAGGSLLLLPGGHRFPLKLLRPRLVLCRALPVHLVLISALRPQLLLSLRLGASQRLVVGCGCRAGGRQDQRRRQCDPDGP